MTRSYEAVPPGRAVPYHHRDPDWLTPGQLAELAARDRRAAMLERMGGASGWQSHLAASERLTEFATLRDHGFTVAEAGERMGVTLGTARRYERKRKAAARLEDT